MKTHHEQIARTFVKHDDKWFFVSTINRSSATDDDFIFAETMAFEWDEENKKTGKIVAEHGGERGSIFKHLVFVEQLGKLGKIIKDYDA